MVHISNRNIQALKIFFSSWIIVLLIVGIIIDEWVELILEGKGTKVKHSPWMVCCSKDWPEDELKLVRVMLILILNLSFFLNLIMGLESTYIIPESTYFHLINASLSFLSGILLLCALLLYHLKLREGKSVYFTNYKINWMGFAGYINVLFFFICATLSLLQCKKPSTTCACLNRAEKSATKCNEVGSSIQVISLPARSAMPRSIVRTHSDTGKEENPNRQQIHARRVTWAL
ncbi:transmembrane protein 225 [Otolemur garnettii]|uniref:Transmembrane protein 225 n=1 Tax=Otolemur garnettii TaxID=30611 RepID=H0XBK2_OTOGA|nr:transmembrane protein 225 [Otolemur garnettii]